jgi:hypothetical protein
MRATALTAVGCVPATDPRRPQRAVRRPAALHLERERTERWPNPRRSAHGAARRGERAYYQPLDAY